MKRIIKIILILPLILIMIVYAVGYIMKHRYDDKGSDFCPRCKSENVGKIFYGLYRGIEDETPEMQEKIRSGKMIPGGCLIYDDSPRYYCNDCGLSWGRILESKK